MNNTPYRAHRAGLRCIRAAQVALGWVVVFGGLHIYWYLGASFASPGKLPGVPHSLIGWTFQVFASARIGNRALVWLTLLPQRLAPHVMGPQRHLHDRSTIHPCSGRAGRPSGRQQAPPGLACW